MKKIIKKYGFVTETKVFFKRIFVRPFQTRKRAPRFERFTTVSEFFVFTFPRADDAFRIAVLYRLCNSRYRRGRFRRIFFLVYSRFVRITTRTHESLPSLKLRVQRDGTLQHDSRANSSFWFFISFLPYARNIKVANRTDSADCVAHIFSLANVNVPYTWATR